VTNPADAVAAAEAGADALGFMFFADSKRHVSLLTAAAIIRELPPLISKVGVFVNATSEEIHRAVAETGIDTLQLHGEETPEFCAQFLPLKVVKAFRLRSRDSLSECLNYPAHAWLLDSYVEGCHGGTGVTVDWSLAAEAARMSRQVILAGGLRVETVAEAVRCVRPHAVDVSSGVESAPGQKDHSKVQAFIKAVRATEI
jgi:phosphoribosylanthranilate isomerase